MPDHAAPTAGVVRRAAGTVFGEPLRTRLLAALAGGLLVSGAWACGDPPVLQVGRVGYDAVDLAGMGPNQQYVLADLTAFGLAVADDRVDELIEPYIRRDIRSMVIQRLALEVAADATGMDDTELRERYEADPDHELDVRHLVILSERWRPAEHRDSARARAREALRRIRAGERFEDVVAEYSDEPGAAERGGLLDAGREGSWVPEFWEAASSLEEGEVSDVVETEFGFHVVRLDTRRVVPFEEVRDRVLRGTVDLAGAFQRTQEWTDIRMEAAAVDTGAIEAWRRGSVTGATLVAWPDSLRIAPFTVDRLESYLISLPPDNVAGARQADSATALGFVLGAARTHLMLRQAEEFDVEPSPSQAAAIEQRWRDQVGQWATALGFEKGMSTDAVRERAIGGLTTVQQNAMQARSRIGQVGYSARRLYPVQRHEPPGD